MHGHQIRNYFNNNEKSSKGGTIEDYIDCVMNVNGKWGTTFEIIYVSIIYRVRIISIANISDGFMVSDALSLLNVYELVNDNTVMPDMYIYLYCHLHKAPTAPCDQDIILNYFAYFEVVEELPTESIRQIFMVIVVIMYVP